MNLSRTSVMVTILIVVLGAPIYWLVQNQDSEPVDAPVLVARETVQTESVTALVTLRQGARVTFRLANMMGGDEFRGSIVIINGEETPLRYGVTMASEESGLNDGLALSLYGPPGSCTADDLPSELLATGLFQTEATTVVGTNGAAEPPRLLRAGQTETLCVQVVLTDDSAEWPAGAEAVQSFTILAVSE